MKRVVRIPMQQANRVEKQNERIEGSVFTALSLFIESFSSKQSKFGKAMKPEKRYPNAFFDQLAHVNYNHTYLPGILTGGVLNGVGKQFSQQEKKQFRVYRDNHGLYQLPNNQKQYITPNAYRYIVSPKGGLYIITQETPNCFHNSVRASQPVQCAGMVRIRNNEITLIDNLSGHYRPTREQLIRTALGLHAAGFLQLDVSVQVFDDTFLTFSRKHIGTVLELKKQEENKISAPSLSN